MKYLQELNALAKRMYASIGDTRKGRLLKPLSHAAFRRMMSKSPELAKKHNARSALFRTLRGQTKRAKKQFGFDLDSIPVTENPNEETSYMRASWLPRSVYNVRLRKGLEKDPYEIINLNPTTSVTSNATRRMEKMLSLAHERDEAIGQRLLDRNKNYRRAIVDVYKLYRKEGVPKQLAYEEAKGLVNLNIKSRTYIDKNPTDSKQLRLVGMHNPEVLQKEFRLGRDLLYGMDEKDLVKMFPQTVKSGIFKDPAYNSTDSQIDAILLNRGIHILRRPSEAKSMHLGPDTYYDRAIKNTKRKLHRLTNTVGYPLLRRLAMHRAAKRHMNVMSNIAQQALDDSN